LTYSNILRFLLAQLHFDSLKGKRSPRALLIALESLARGSNAYNTAYHNAMERIQGQLTDQKDLAMQGLSWIICAKRPITTTELEHALGVEPKQLYLDHENIPDLSDLVSNCCGLLTIDKESNIVRLVHYTTQKYFEQTISDWFPNAQSDLTKTCVTYLSFTAFENGICLTDSDFENRLLLYPFYDYASHYWGDHARFSSEYEFYRTFLEMEAQVNASSQALFAINDWWSARNYSQRVPRQMIGLHLAAIFGLSEIMIGCNDRDLDVPNNTYRTPLSWAAEYGHESVVKLLLETGKVDVDSKDNYGQTPLSWAAENGHESVVKLLLETGKVDVDSKDNYGQTPLWWAAQNGHESVVKLLLETGKVDVDLKDTEYGQKPLWWAAQNGHESVVKLLLETGKVDVDSKDTRYGRTPLWWAAQNGHESVVKLLLETGKVDVDAKDNNNRTPLSWTAQNGHESVVKLLLKTGKVDVDSKDNYGQTPLSWAAENGREAVVKLLLETGQVDVDAKDNNNRTPLSWTAQNGHEAVVKLLLETEKVVVDSKDIEYGRTPLSWAAEGGNQATVDLIVKYGANLNAVDFGGLDAFGYAVFNNQTVVEDFLLSLGINSEDTYGFRILFQD
jgi:ankyrin repeat protein